MNEELISKLKILDRIELRQRMEILDKDKNDSAVLPFIWKMFGLLAFVVTWALIFYCNGYMTQYYFFMNIFSSTTKLMVLGAVILLFLDFIFAIIYLKKRKKLISEYFKVEIKPNGNKK